MATRPVTPKLNCLVQAKKPLSKTSQHFFVMLHVVFALDFGYIKFKSPKMNVLSKLITLAQSTALSVNIIIPLFDSTNTTVYTYSALFLDVLVYFAFTLTLMGIKNKWHDFQIDLNTFDVAIKVDSNTCRVETQIISWFYLLLAYRFTTIVLYCRFFLDSCELPIHVQVSYAIELVGVDVVLVVYSYVFYCAYLRLKNFTSFVNSDAADIVSGQYLYKSVAEIIEKVKKSFDVVFILTLVTNTTDAIMHIYLPFANKTVKSSNAFDTSVAYVIVAQQLLLLFSPALTAGLLASQVEQLKLVLNKMLIEGDKTRTKDIRRFVAYIEGRPLRFRVWRVVPLDWRLPIIVINISVTYLIVMIQFTHSD